jgi:hypothetical protein
MGNWYIVSESIFLLDAPSPRKREGAMSSLHGTTRPSLEKYAPFSLDLISSPFFSFLYELSLPNGPSKIPLQGSPASNPLCVALPHIFALYRQHIFSSNVRCLSVRRVF